MSFQYPIAFFALLAVPAIIAMYLLKQKHKEHIVPSIMLWQKVYFMSLSQKPWQKLKRNLLMATQILLAILVTLALARPFFNREAYSGDVILVLDVSLMMQATDVKPNRLEHAKEMMRDFLDKLPHDTRISVVTAGSDANIEANFSADKEYIKNVIKGIDVTYSAVQPEAARNLVDLLLSGARETCDVYVFSGTELGMSLGESYFLVGSGAENTGITLLANVTEPDRIVVMAKLKNFGQSNATRDVALYADDSLYDVKEVSLAPGQERDVFFTQVPRDISRLTARLSESGDDILTADDIRYDVVRNELIQKCVLVTKGNIFLEKALQLLPSIDLYKADENAAEGLTGYYLYVFDGILPEVMPDDGHIIIINPPVGNTFLETDEEVEINHIYTNRTRFVDFFSEFDFAVSKAKKVSAPLWAERILSADGTDLIFAGENGKTKIMVISFDLHNSDLPLKKEFPIFINNIASWFVDGISAELKEISVGDTIVFNLYPDVTRAAVVGADDRVTVIAPPFPAMAFTQTSEPGFYLLDQLTRDGNKYSEFAVNIEPVALHGAAATPSASNTQALDSGNKNVIAHNLRNIFLLLCLIILFVEWWVYSRD